VKYSRILALLMLLATIPLAAQGTGTSAASSKRTSPDHSPSPSATQPGAGRFHLLEVKTPGRSTAGTIEPYDEVFLYDTATGRVWIYEPPSPVLDDEIGKNILVPAYFDELTIKNLHGSTEAGMDSYFKLYDLALEAAKSYCNKNPNGAYHATSKEAGPGTDCTDFLAKHPDPVQK
jgi:hypothetical protein